MTDEFRDDSIDSLAVVVSAVHSSNAPSETTATERSWNWCFLEKTVQFL
jgi:hypothetical protein